MNMTYTYRLAQVAVAALMLASGSDLLAGATRLQVMATGDETKAKAGAEALDGAGFGPAEVRHEGTLFKVLTRPYPSLAEANFAKPVLHGKGYSGVFAVAEPAAAGQAGAEAAGTETMPSITTGKVFEQVRMDYKLAKPARTAPKITPEQEALDDATASEGELLGKCLGWWKKSHAPAAVKGLQTFLRRFPQSADVVRAKLMLGYWLVETGEAGAARAQFQAVVGEHAASELAGEAALRVAYLELRSGNQAAALQGFLSLSRGEVPASAEVRAEAMLRTAALYHRGRDLESADAAYAAVAGAIRDPETQAFAQMQRAGIALEKAWNGQGSFAGARAMCDDLLAKYPGAAKLTRATATLMALETLCYEGKYQEVVAREESAMRELSGTPEGDLGYYWIAKSRLETGDTAAAARLLDGLVAADLPTESRFKDVTIRSQARALAANAHEKLGNSARAQELRQMR